jgi:pimeloyl-ACP methyl ester carboxylesterase
VEVETVHQIITKIRSSNPSPLPRTFAKIIYAGHSYGSILGNSLVAKYPTDVDALLLTGYSSKYLLALPGTTLSADLLPADTISPDRFGAFSPGYLEISSSSGFDYLFYRPGGFDPALQALDFSIRGTFATGEVIIFALGINTVPKYTGPVYMMTGQHDAFSCNPLNLVQSQIDCGTGTSGYVVSTSSLFPAAKSFGVFIVPHSGHCWHFHTAAPSAFDTAHVWMAGEGF